MPAVRTGSVSDRRPYPNIDAIAARLTTWLNELAFVPIDVQPDAPVDEWSGDGGCGVQYLSQQALDRLIPRSGLPIDTGLDLPAGKSVELKPGGYHVMLIDLKAPLKEGESVPLTLVFEGPDRRQETVEIKAPVRALTTRGGSAPMHGGHKH